MKKLNYRNRDGFSPDIWGPPTWFLLHLFAQNFPVDATEKQRRGYMRFFRSLCYVLPCWGCRVSYASFVRQHPRIKITPDKFRDRKSVTKWVFDLHNAVNEKLQKPKRTNFTKHYRSYERFRSSHPRVRETLVTILPSSQRRMLKRKSVSCI
jgi:hypothetical protein